MEAKIATKKTKAEIENDFPIIHPKDCPRELMKWIAKRDVANMQTIRLLIRDELRPIRRFMRMAVANRIWLVILSAIVFVLGFILIYHLMAR